MLFEAPMRDMQIYIGLQALYQLALSIARRCAALPPAAFCGDWTLNLHFEAAVLRVFLKPRGVRLNLGTRVQNSIYKIALILIIYIYIYIYPIAFGLPASVPQVNQRVNAEPKKNKQPKCLTCIVVTWTPLGWEGPLQPH